MESLAKLESELNELCLILYHKQSGNINIFWKEVMLLVDF